MCENVGVRDAVGVRGKCVCAFFFCLWEPRKRPNGDLALDEHHIEKEGRTQGSVVFFKSDLGCVLCQCSLACVYSPRPSCSGIYNRRKAFAWHLPPLAFAGLQYTLFAHRTREPSKSPPAVVRFSLVFSPFFVQSRRCVCSSVLFRSQQNTHAPMNSRASHNFTKKHQQMKRSNLLGEGGDGDHDSPPPSHHSRSRAA